MIDNKRPQLNLRLDKHIELYAAVQDAAKEQNISITAFVINALKVAVGMQDEQVAEVKSNNVLDMLDVIDQKLDTTLDIALDAKLSDETMLNKLADIVLANLKKDLA